MKPSRYNFIFTLDEEKYLAYNSLRNGLAVVDDRVRSVIETGAGELEPELSHKLATGGFLTDDGLDEVDLLKIRRRSLQFDRRSLSLTIIPTLACNLACTYCYETPDPQVMDDHTADRIVEFARSNLENGVRAIDVTWYGGEPLLCFDRISELGERLLKLCEEHQARHTSRIVTNGTLLTRERAGRLKELGVEHAQITIDGNRAAHDQRRPYRSGRGSFDKIVANLAEVAGVLPLAIRVNVDRSNVDDALAFFDQLSTEPWYDRESISVYYGQVRKMTTSCRCPEEEILQPGEFFEHQLALY